MEKEITKKIDALEAEYKQEKRLLEETTEDVLQENRLFKRELEELADYISHLSKKDDGIDPQAIRKAYHLIQEAQEEGQQVVKKTLNKLEDEREEKRLAYQKQRSSYEEELAFAVKGGEA